MLDILTDEYKRLGNGDITEEELNLAKDKIIKSKIREMQSSNMWVGYHLPDILFNPKEPVDLAEWLNRIQKIEIDKVREVSKKYFLRDKWCLAMCGDIEEKDFDVNY